MKPVTIASVKVSSSFGAASDYFGYSRQDKIKLFYPVHSIAEHWRAQGYVEIFDDDRYQDWARAKDSNSVYASSPYYVGLFHVHVFSSTYDPMIIISFEPVKVEDKSITHCVIIHTLISHKRMFGEFGREKADPAAMRILREDVRQKVEEFHQQKIRYPALRADN